MSNYSWWESSIKISSKPQLDKLVTVLMQCFNPSEISSVISEQMNGDLDDFKSFNFDISQLPCERDQARVMNRIVDEIVQNVSSDGHFAGYSDDGEATLFSYVNGEFKEVDFSKVAEANGIKVVFAEFKLKEFIKIFLISKCD